MSAFLLWTMLVAADPKEAPCTTDRACAERILRDFGTNDGLTRDGLKRYLMAEAFKRLDANGDSRLDFTEFLTSRFRVGKAAALDLPTLAAEFSAWAANPVLGRISELTADWSSRVDQAAKAHCIRFKKAGFCDPTSEVRVTVAEVEAYLAGERAAAGRPRQASERLARLAELRGKSSGSQTVDVDRDEFTLLACAEDFEDLDIDRSDRLDLAEFSAGGRKAHTVAEFTRLSGDDFMLERPEYCGATLDSELGVSHQERANALWAELTGNNRATMSYRDFERSLAEIEHRDREAQDEERRKKAPSRYVTGRGLRLFGAATEDRHKMPSFDEERVTLFLRILKDFDKTGADAAPALASYIYDQEAHEGTTATDAAVRVDLWLPTLRDRGQLSVGYESNRSGRDATLSDVRSYYVEFTTSTSHSLPVLAGSTLRVAPVFENNHAKNVSTWVGVVEWIPELDLGPIISGAWLSRGPAGVYFIPKAGLELGRAVTEPLGTTPEDRSYWRGALELGAKVGEQIKLQYAWERRWRFGEPENHTYQDTTLSWELERRGNYSIVLNYAVGEPPPEFKRTRFYKVALGLKF